MKIQPISYHYKPVRTKAYSKPTIAPRFSGQDERIPYWQRQFQDYIRELVARNYFERTPLKDIVTNLFAPIISEAKMLALLPNIQHVSFKSLDGLSLNGYWLPSKGSSDRTIILGHGYGANARHMSELAKKLAETMNTNVFFFDFRAHGDSEGEKTSLGFHEGLDVAAAVEYVKHHYAGQSKTLFYLGHSMGAAAIMLLPASLGQKYQGSFNLVKDSLNGMILDAPYAGLDFETVPFVSRLYDYRLPDGRPLWLLSDIGQRLFKKPITKLAREFQAEAQQELNLPFPISEMRPGEIFSKSDLSQKPVLLLHGDKDTVTDYQQGCHIAKLMSKDHPNFKFVTLHGADHTSRQWLTGEPYLSSIRGKNNGEEYLNALAEFLSANEAKPATTDSQ